MSWYVKGALSLSLWRVRPLMCSWNGLGRRYLSTKGRDFAQELYDDIVLRKTLTANKSLDNEKIRCTIFNSSGDIVNHGEEIMKTQFMKDYNLVPRDFRKISRHYHSNNGISVDIVPSIITRNNWILLNLLNIRALIRHNRVVIFDSFSHPGSGLNESHSHGIFLSAIQEKLKGEGESGSEILPYEFRALEAILINVTNNLSTEMKVHKTVLQNVLNGLETHIDRVKLRYLLIQSKKISQFHQKSMLIRDLLDSILEQDDELNSFYLTETSMGSQRQYTNHAEIEILLESYYKTCDEIVQTVENLMSEIKTSEEIINIVLDSNRNELMLLGLKFSTGLLSMGVALYLSALYGMNLENFIEESDGGFELVVILGCFLIFIMGIVGVKKLNQLQKITMTGAVKNKKYRKTVQ